MLQGETYVSALKNVVAIALQEAASIPSYVSDFMTISIDKIAAVFRNNADLDASAQSESLEATISLYSVGGLLLSALLSLLSVLSLITYAPLVGLRTLFNAVISLVLSYAICTLIVWFMANHQHWICLVHKIIMVCVIICFVYYALCGIGDIFGVITHLTSLSLSRVLGVLVDAWYLLMLPRIVNILCSMTPSIGGKIDTGLTGGQATPNPDSASGVFIAGMDSNDDSDSLM